MNQTRLRSVVTGRFKRDYKRVGKQGKNIGFLHDTMNMIISRQRLPARYRDHTLEGNYKGWRECHIRPDWLLIYRIEGDKAVFGRTGSHAELFE